MSERMVIGIMQPYFFPFIGYYQLMQAVDTWVVFDDTQFIDKGWINRNRILHPDARKGWQYITVPLNKRGQFDKIKDVSIKHDGHWQEKILGKLSAYKRKAPYYDRTMKLVTECLSMEEKNLSKFLVATIVNTARALDIDITIHIQSQMAVDYSSVQHAGQWALVIAQQMGATEYINPHGGASLFSENEFQSAGVRLRFLKPQLKRYVQRRDGFLPGLSILDVMMWNSLSEIEGMVARDFMLLEKRNCLG